MKIEALNYTGSKNGKPYSLIGAVGDFLDSIDVGENKDVSALIKANGEEVPLMARFSMYMNKLKGDRAFMTRKVEDAIRVWRIK